MTQQDNTAPVYPVKISRTERFRCTFQVFQNDESTPANLTGAKFFCDLMDSSGMVKLKLEEGVGISRPDASSVLVTVSTAQMLGLSAGQYNAILYANFGAERENFVFIKLTVE